MSLRCLGLALVVVSLCSAGCGGDESLISPASSGGDTSMPPPDAGTGGAGGGGAGGSDAGAPDAADAGDAADADPPPPPGTDPGAGPWIPVPDAEVLAKCRLD